VVAVALLALPLQGCVDTFPDKVPLVPAAATVEVVTEVPNKDVYEPAGEVTSTVIGREFSDTLRQAWNHLRNQGAAKGASFVSVDDVSSRAAWDFSGRVVVSVSGTAYKPREK